MKVTIQCAHCLLERAINQVKLATSDTELQMKVTTAIIEMLSSEFSDQSVPSHIGTDRDLIVQKMTGKDPYYELKKMSNTMALSILPDLQKIVEQEETPRARFRKATLITAAANAIEFDVSGRDFSLDELRDIVDRVEEDLAIDQVDEFMNLCQTAEEVVYLMDNAGEVVLDMILIKEIKRLGPKVFAVVKGGPILNDATMVDADEVGLGEYADKVYDTGSPSIGVNHERNSSEFISLLESTPLIVAKGMGNFEAMTEFEPTAPTVHIMRTKCMPVAQHVGCERGKNVVLIRKPNPQS
ncbi:MAG: damage-control phosphatase ARMT1 family protein [Candidatus Thorarchaeota archaeon]